MPEREQSLFTSNFLRSRKNSSLSLDGIDELLMVYLSEICFISRTKACNVICKILKAYYWNKEKIHIEITSLQANLAVFGKIKFKCNYQKLP